MRSLAYQSLYHICSTNFKQAVAPALLLVDALSLVDPTFGRFSLAFLSLQLCRLQEQKSVEQVLGQLGATRAASAMKGNRLVRVEVEVNGKGAHRSVPPTVCIYGSLL